MYDKMKSCMRSTFRVTEIFKLMKGFCQGCPLSHFLLAFILNDLEDFFFKDGANGINLWDVHIFPLIRAGDLILTATNEYDLKLQMDLLGQFAEKCNININAKNTKEMVFNYKSWRKID